MDAYQRKRPGVAVTPGLSSIRCQKDPMSTARRASGRHICRLTDHPTRPLTDPQGIRPTSRHCFLRMSFALQGRAFNRSRFLAWLPL